MAYPEESRGSNTNLGRSGSSGFLQKRRAGRSRQDAAVSRRSPKHDTIRPSEAGLYGVLTAASRGVDIRNGELLEHLWYCAKAVKMMGRMR